MSEAQRVGQLFLVGIAGEPVPEVVKAVRTYHFGSLLFEGTSTASAAQIRDMTRAVQSQASSSATARAGFFIAANQEGGEVQELQGPGFPAIPPALAQGQLSPRLQRQAAAWGRDLRSAGVNLAAGGDLITSQSLGAATAMDQAILQRAAVDSGFRATVNSAVMHILDAKQTYHLMPCH